MSAEDDKYPESSGRRRFVKGVVGSAALVGVGTATGASLETATFRSGHGGGTTQFYGIENIAGPAPRAMPLIPIEIDGDGFIKGIYPEVKQVEQKGQTVTVAEQELGGITYSVEWYQYCGVQSYQGLQPSYDGDNYFRYSQAPPAAYKWQQEDVEAGAKVNIADFEGYQEWGNGIGKPGLGKPAMGTWRSQDTDNTMPVQIIRSTQIEEITKNPQTDGEKFLAAASAQGTLAWLDKCTHFCCVPGFKATKQSIQFDAANDVYCPCHQSVYNPFSIVKRSFVAYPRPEES